MRLLSSCSLLVVEVDVDFPYEREAAEPLTRQDPLAAMAEVLESRRVCCSLVLQVEGRFGVACSHNRPWPVFREVQQ